MTGIVKQVFGDRGFGFIAAEDGIQYFFHYSSLAEPAVFRALREGDEVAFMPVSPMPTRGPRASDVVRLAEVPA